MLGYNVFKKLQFPIQIFAILLRTPVLFVWDPGLEPAASIVDIKFLRFQILCLRSLACTEFIRICLRSLLVVPQQATADLCFFFWFPMAIFTAPCCNACLQLEKWKKTAFPFPMHSFGMKWCQGWMATFVERRSCGATRRQCWMGWKTIKSGYKTLSFRHQYGNLPHNVNRFDAMNLFLQEWNS